MDGWTVGLIVMFAVGLAVIVFGALSDRRKNRRAVSEMLSPPPRTIPRLPADAARPRYVSALQARRVTEPRPALNDDQQRRLAQQLKAADTVHVRIGFASDAFVTDEPTARAVLDHPRILVCAEPIMAIRELIGVLEHMITDRTPLVVVAPMMAPEVLDTLEVNHLQRAVDVVAILSRDPVPTDVIVQATGATLISRVDLQTGYLSDHELGRCARWVSDRRSSYIVGSLSGRTDEDHQP
ncbi:hypothetical protein [Microlunatus sp. Gsoil 973]|uniref:hypothetical protein n=1 Tax=Microlunatus sp. Gsoil 973 TaxID=2672569 RepID=UPI0012B4C792|nr:hypothetical protein [Microlunatus sp. Gsoil 973]QGN34802.1 hypothetical protein GJV80_20465 [Microlunatus sp. Gsoil 973]